ncbi:sugar phosphate isomerase/epimerase [soil metagenome]
MHLGYNTNGFAHHALEDAIDILAGLGYAAIALTPDVHHLPFNEDQYAEIDLTRCRLEHHKMKCVIETGARFLLDSKRKHQPTLLTPTKDERDFRRDVLEDHIDLAKGLGVEVVSFWSGTSLTDEAPSVLMTRLVDECKSLGDHAASRSVKIAFEPEPGMFIDTMDKFAELFEKVNHPAFGLTIDVGHLVCLDELPISKHLLAWKHVLWNVHLDDMKRGIHDHLAFGGGDVDFNDLFAGMKAAKFSGIASVELSRHSYDAVNVATQSQAFLRQFT